MENSKAPWTDEQVENLKKRQANNMMHQYTCVCDGNIALIPTKEGWVCPECDYTQKWCHKSDSDPTK